MSNPTLTIGTLSITTHLPQRNRTTDHGKTINPATAEWAVSDDDKSYRRTAIEHLQSVAADYGVAWSYRQAGQQLDLLLTEIDHLSPSGTSCRPSKAAKRRQRRSALNSLSH